MKKLVLCCLVCIIYSTIAFATYPYTDTGDIDPDAVANAQRQALLAIQGTPETVTPQPTQPIEATYQREEPQSTVAQFVSRINGEWYDYSGNLVLTIKDSYINGCQVVGGFDFAGGYPMSGTLRITEASGTCDIHINAFGKGYHKYLVIGGNTPLRQTPNAQYFESVDGVYLGMNPQEVIRACGKPTQIDTNKLRGSNTAIYHYQEKGIAVRLDDNIVTSITLGVGSPLHFDKSGYNCMNSLENYYTKYSLNRLPTTPMGKYSSNGAYAIGNGEYLFFDGYPNTVILSIYSN